MGTKPFPSAEFKNSLKFSTSWTSESYVDRYHWWSYSEKNVNHSKKMFNVRVFNFFPIVTTVGWFKQAIISSTRLLKKLLVDLKSWFPKFAFCVTFLAFHSPEIRCVPRRTRPMGYPTLLEWKMSIVDFPKISIKCINRDILVENQLRESWRLSGQALTDPSERFYCFGWSGEFWTEVASQSSVYTWQLGGRSRCLAEIQPPSIMIHLSSLWLSQEYDYGDE